jgi:hypothetical protein
VSTAPNYDGDYPGAGEKIGPTWQAVWDHLENGRWVTARTLVHEHCELVKTTTVYDILRRASDKGLIEKAYRKKPGRHSVYMEYRRTDSDVVKPKSESDIGTSVV